MFSPFGSQNAPSTASVKQSPFRSVRSNQTHNEHEPTESEAVSITLQSVPDTSQVSSIMRVGGASPDELAKKQSVPSDTKIYFQKTSNSIFNNVEARHSDFENGTFDGEGEPDIASGSSAPNNGNVTPLLGKKTS